MQGWREAIINHSGFKRFRFQKFKEAEYRIKRKGGRTIKISSLEGLNPKLHK
jgi:hypothetical protein